MVIAYPARSVVRRYAIDAAPLARALLGEGQRAHGKGIGFVIATIDGDADGVLRYRGEGHELCETDLDANLDVAMPENRMRIGQVDELTAFDLRHAALRIRHQMLASPARGFLGGRIRLFDHQLSIARDVCDRHRVRVLLADEVGLGKTIEALLILHRMLLSGRVERALVMAPAALVHQWLAEAYHRFNLILRVIGSDTFGGGSIDPERDDVPLELQSAQLFVCPLGIPIGKAFIASEWDLLVVDEAHHLSSDSAEFALVEKLARRIDHVLLLSATPDRDGEHAHFQRLALLDPVRFADADEYLREAASYRELADTAERLVGDAPLRAADRKLLKARLRAKEVTALLGAADTDRDARSTLLARLLDLHGIGRVMFRNVRARIPGFPRRVHVAADLVTGDAKRLRREFLHDIGHDASFRFGGAEGDPRTAWLDAFLRARPDERVLVLCADRAKVEGFADALATGGRQIARFHEQMSALERDRQAAWFLAPDGPQLLISSQVGAEGRNFQVARNLVLLDLPLTADRLEQLIGRVDRIGQGDEVRVFVPVLPGTPQARLRRWFEAALAVFARPWHGAPVIDREFGEELLQALLARDESALESLLERGRERNQQILAELEGGRDRLLELTSFDHRAARGLHQAIDDAEQGRDLQRFMLDAMERGGLEAEDIGDRSFIVRAGPGYHRPFPGFHGREMSITFDRATGLMHPERVLLSWDHPLVRDTLDVLLARETGNATIARLVGEPTGLQLEALYVAEPTLPRDLRADRFLPPTPIRLRIDANGHELDPLDEDARASLQPIDAALLRNPHVAARLLSLINLARAAATAKGPAIAAQAREHMRRELLPVVGRLTELAAVNPSVTQAELAAAHHELTTLEQGLADLRIRLDALRLIVVAP